MQRYENPERQMQCTDCMKRINEADKQQGTTRLIGIDRSQEWEASEGRSVGPNDIMRSIEIDRGMMEIKSTATDITRSNESKR